MKMIMFLSAKFYIVFVLQFTKMEFLYKQQKKMFESNGFKDS